MTSVMGRALSRKILGEPENALPLPVQPLKAMPLNPSAIKNARASGGANNVYQRQNC